VAERSGVLVAPVLKKFLVWCLAAAGGDGSLIVLDIAHATGAQAPQIINLATRSGYIDMGCDGY
jgi:hypothetical protein